MADPAKRPFPIQSDPVGHKVCVDESDIRQAQRDKLQCVTRQEMTELIQQHNARVEQDSLKAQGSRSPTDAAEVQQIIQNAFDAQFTKLTSKSSSWNACKSNAQQILERKKALAVQKLGKISVEDLEFAATEAIDEACGVHMFGKGKQ